MDSGRSDQATSCLRTSGMHIGDVQDHNCFQVGSSLIFQASCLAVWQGQVYSVQVSFSFHKNSCELSLISFQSGQLVGEVLGSEEQIGPANQVDSCTSTTDGENFPKISTISSF